MVIICRSYAGNHIGSQAVSVFRIVLIHFKPAGNTVKTIEAIRCSYPKFMILIFINTTDKIVADAGWVVRIVPENGHFYAIITIESVTRAEIHKPAVSLCNAINAG